jgi:hypothetical protein
VSTTTDVSGAGIETKLPFSQESVFIEGSLQTFPLVWLGLASTAVGIYAVIRTQWQKTLSNLDTGMMRLHNFFPTVPSIHFSQLGNHQMKVEEGIPPHRFQFPTCINLNCKPFANESCLEQSASRT